jgi:hypothetical protein
MLGYPSILAMHSNMPGYPRILGMHSNMPGYLSIWECIPRYWGTPVHGKAFSYTGILQDMGIHAHILRHPNIVMCSSPEEGPSYEKPKSRVIRYLQISNIKIGSGSARTDVMLRLAVWRFLMAPTTYVCVLWIMYMLLSSASWDFSWLGPQPGEWTSQPQYIGMHSRIVWYPNSWECMPINWGTPQWTWGPHVHGEYSPWRGGTHVHGECPPWIWSLHVHAEYSSWNRGPQYSSCKGEPHIHGEHSPWNRGPHVYGEYSPCTWSLHVHGE